MIDKRSKPENENVPDYKLVFESLPGNFLILQPEFPYHILAANKALLLLIGRHEREVIGKSIVDFYRLNTREANLVQLENALKQLAEQKKEGEMFVARYKTGNSNDLSERFWRAESKPVLSKNGKLLFIVHTLKDPGNYAEAYYAGDASNGSSSRTRKPDDERTNEAISKSERNLRNLILQAPVAICIFRGPEYIIEIANDLMLQSWDKTEEEVLNKPVYEALPEARGQGFEDLLYSVYTTGETVRAYGVAGTLTRKGVRETYYVNLVYQALKDVNGQISGILVVNIDVTEQILSRRKIEEAEERARLAIESAELGTYEVNLLNDELFASPRLAEIFDVKNDADRHRYVSAIHPDDLPVRAAAYEAAYQTGILEYEARVVKTDRSIRWIRVKGKTYYDYQGKPLRLIGVVQDISTEKETSRLKDDFISLVSHELKTPITSLKGYTQILNRKFSAAHDTMATGMLGKMHEQVKRLHYIVQDLLDVSRIENNKIKFRTEEFDFNELVTQTLEEVQRTSDSHQIILSTSGSAVIRADKERTSQVLINLLTNALTYSPAGSEIMVGTYTENADVICYVKDFGPGIEKSKQGRIFERFYQADNINRYNGGLGLGLFISAEIIKRQNGRTWVESTPGRGATFYFSLPV